MSIRPAPAAAHRGKPVGGAVSATGGHGGPGAGAAVAAARPVVLVRYRPGVVGETARTVHVVPLPTSPAGEPGAGDPDSADAAGLTPGRACYQPREDSLWLCREIDLFGALRTALNGAPPGGPPPSGDPL